MRLPVDSQLVERRSFFDFSSCDTQMANKTLPTTLLRKCPDVCRICLSSDSGANSEVDLYPIEDIYVQQCHLTEFISSFRDILTIFVNDEMNTHGQRLPSAICLRCAKQAQEAFKFVEQCRRSDQLLEAHFDSLRTTQTECDKNQTETEEVSEDHNLPAEAHLPVQTETQIAIKLETQAAPKSVLEQDEDGKPKKKRFNCDKCSKSFSQSQTLRRHERSHDKTGSNVKSCTFCSKTFLRADDLTRHIRTHTGERPYKCTVCPKAYKQWSELNEHCLTHMTQKLFQCPECSKELTSRNGLYVHMKIHRGDKRFVCTHCSKRFTTSCALTAHMRRAHPQNSTDQTAEKQLPT